MLGILRNKNIARKILLATLAVVLPGLVFWGTGGFDRLNIRRPAYVGTIYGQKVSFDEFGKALAAIRCQIILNHFNRPDAVNSLLNNKGIMGRSAWQRIILAKEAMSRKITVSDKEVINFIRSHPLFLRGGKFDEKFYSQILKYGFEADPRAFEEIVRENLSIDRSNEMITGDVSLSDEEILNNYRYDNAVYNISYVRIETSDFIKDMDISSAEIMSYYEKHRVQYILMQREAGVETESIMANFEKVKGSILLTLAEIRARPAALKYAEDLRKNIVEAAGGGKITFEEACAGIGIKVRETAVSSKKGYPNRIGNADAVAAECGRLKEGNVSMPVEVPMGFMIFRVKEVEKFDEDKFDKEKDEKERYSKELLKRKKTAKLEDWIRGAELNTRLNIDLGEYERYYPK